MNTLANQGEEAAKQHQYSCIESSKLINKEINLTEESQQKKEAFNRLMALLPTCSKMEELENRISSMEKEKRASNREIEIRAWIDASRDIMNNELRKKLGSIFDAMKGYFKLPESYIYYHHWKLYGKIHKNQNPQIKSYIEDAIVYIAKNHFKMPSWCWYDIDKYYSVSSDNIHKRKVVNIDEINIYIDETVPQPGTKAILKDLFSKVAENDQKII